MKHENKKTGMRFFTALLALTMAVLFALSACANPADEPDDSTPTPTEEPTAAPASGNDLFARTEDGTTLVFRVVRGDFAEKEEINAAVQVVKALSAASGATVTIVTDYDDKKDNGDICEIVVGNTNRTCTVAVPAEENAWLIASEGKKIFLLGNSIGAIGEAVTMFCGMAELNAGKSEWFFAENYSATGVWLDPEVVPDDGNPKVLYGLSQQQADNYFGAILEGLFTGETTEVIDTKTQMGSNFGMHFPDMVYFNGEYWAYYICYRTKTGKGGVGLAKSSDGVNFENCGCVIQPDEDYDCNGAYFAGVWYDEEEELFYITYECKGGADTEYGTLENVAWATSEDGVNWEKKGVLFYKDKTLNWQTANVGTPDLYKEGDVWYVFFHGFDYKTCQIGVAYGEDLSELVMVKEPIIPTVAGTPYGGTTGRRDVIYVNGWYYMVYEVSTEQAKEGGYGGANWTHMFARSQDLLEWETVEAPLVSQKTAGFGYDGTNWCIIGKHIYVYFRVGNHTERAELVLNTDGQ